ncbi:MAG: PAS-domain containing protein [Roseibium sp.]|nr:PAS-domain containing protein [Roseibium sp.]
MTKVQWRNETERLKALDALQIMHSERLPEYDAVVEIVAGIFECPISLVSLVGDEEQWFKAKCGLEADGTARDVSFCQHTILSDDLLVIPDARTDDRFKDNPLVTGAPHIRFYAGCPLSIDGKNRLGTLCVIDREPKSPTEDQLAQLRRLGAVVEGLIKSHQAGVETQKAMHLAAEEHKTAVREGDLLEEIATVSGVGGWELDLETGELNWTEKTREIHEVSEDYEPSVEHAINFYAPESRETISAAVGEAIEKRVDWDLELPFITAKGRRIWVRAAGRPIVIDGEVKRLIGAFQDITDRKQSEEAIRHSEAVHRTTLETLREGILLLDRTGKILSSNSAAASLLGYLQGELNGLSVRHLNINCFTEDGEADAMLLQRAAQSPGIVNNFISRVEPNNGSQSVWLRIDANATDSEAGGDDEVVVSLTDITETKHQAETLKTVFENMPGGLVYYDENLRLTACNEEYRELLQVPREFIENKAPIREVFTYLAHRGDYGPGDPDQLVQQHVERFVSNQSHVYERVRPDGTTLEVRGIPLPNGGLVANFFDVTERKQAELAVQHSEAVLRTTLETLREGILLLNRSGDILSANPAAARLLGYGQDDLHGKNVQDLNIDCFTEKGIADVDLLLRASKQPDTVNNFTAKADRKDGSLPVWLRIDANETDGDETNEVVVSLADITETKHQAETLQALFDNMPGGLIFYDEEGHLSVCNDEFKRLAQLPDEFIESHAQIRDVVTFLAERGDYGPGNPEELIEERLALFAKQEPHVYERVCPDRTILEIRGIPLESGGLIASFFDISERKRIELGIRQSEAVHRTTLSSLSEGILLVSHAGEIQSANPAAVALLGVRSEDLLGRNVADFEFGIQCEIEGIGECWTPLELAAHDPHAVKDLIARVHLEDGARTTWLRLNAEPVDQDQEFELDGVVISLTDITETKEQAETLQVIFDNFPGGFAHYDENFQLGSCNAEFQRLLEYPEELVAQKLHILDYLKFNAERGDYGEGNPEELALEVFNAYDRNEPFSYERSAADGSHLEIRSTPLPSGGAIYNFFDVTERKRMQEKLAENERFARDRSAELEAVLANMRQGVSVFDKNGKLTLWNQQYIDIFGKPDGEVQKGKSLVELIQAEKDRDEFEGDVQEHVMDLLNRMSEGEVVRSKFPHPTGKVILAVHAPMPDGGWIGTHEDVTLREQAAAKIAFAAHHDALTGLANRMQFNATLEEALDDARFHETNSALLLIDLDKFKPVNDTYGHDVGDELLIQVAKRLKDVVRSNDLVARLGGDEFAIILKGTGWDNVVVTDIAESVLAKLRTPFEIFAHKLTIGGSIGISGIDIGSPETSTIVKNADIALYQVKNTVRNDFRFFDDTAKPRAVLG